MPASCFLTDLDYGCRLLRFWSTWIRAIPPARVNRCQKTRVSGLQQVSSGRAHTISIWVCRATDPFNVPSFARFPWQYQTTLARDVQVAQHGPFTSAWYRRQSRPKDLARRLFLIDRVVRPCALGRGRQRVFEWSSKRSTARYRRDASTSRVSIRSCLHLVPPGSERRVERSRQSARFQRVPHRFSTQVPSRNDGQHWFSAQQRRQTPVVWSFVQLRIFAHRPRRSLQPVLFSRPRTPSKFASKRDLFGTTRRGFGRGGRRRLLPRSILRRSRRPEAERRVCQSGSEGDEPRSDQSEPGR